MFHAWVTAQGEAAPAALPAPSSQEHLPNPTVTFLETLKTLEERCEQWRHGRTPERCLSRDELSELVRDRVQTWLVLSVGHDDYTVIPGGVQVCIQREQEAVRQAGGHYLNIHPWQPLPRLAHLEEDADPLMVVTLDGLGLGTCRVSELAGALGRVSERGVGVSVVVHHFLGHNPERLADLVRASRAPGCMVWLHDFFTLCPSFRLERNDLEFCGAPSISSNACNLCVYGEERSAHLARMRALFSAVPVTVLSPSQVTLDLWQRRATFPAAGAHVVPHVELTWSRRAIRRPPRTKGPFRVAFLGSPSAHKGWPVFQRLSHDPMLIDDFDFFALTAEKVRLRGKRVRVHVKPERPNAMADAVAERAIDLVVHWPSWAETFSLTTYEALQGGAYIITNTVSGNVAETVRETQRGAVLENEADLFAFFRDGRASALAQHARRDRGEHLVSARMSDLSLPFLPEHA